MFEALVGASIAMMLALFITVVLTPSSDYEDCDE
jgi:hypothetical protein